MKTKNTTQTFVIALAMMLALAIVPTLAFGQTRILNPPQEQGNTLVGVWEAVSPATFDCQTGLPDPNAPKIRVLYNFMQGGTMSEENTDPIDGPYRTTSHGIWKRISGRYYEAVYLHYSFAPDRTFTFTVKLRQNITLSRDSNSITDYGTFEVLDPNDNDKVVFSGCFSDTATRLKF